MGSKSNAKMAWIGFALVLLLVLATASQEDQWINIHTCRLQGRDSLLCDLRGVRHYAPDRPLTGIRSLEFTRFNRGGSITLNRGNAPNMKQVVIHDGDASCRDLALPQTVEVIVGGRSCMVNKFNFRS